MTKNNKNLFSTYFFMMGLVFSPLSAFASYAEPSLDQFIEMVMKERNIPGLQLAVVKGNKVVKQASYGMADLQHNVPVTDKTLFAINSMTKAFTGVAILQLVDQGVIKLDDKIGLHLPSLPLKWHELTIKQLMAHTTGLPEILASTSSLELIVPGNIDASWQAVQERPFLFNPNSRFSYNQTGYIVLGKLIERYIPEGFTHFITDFQLKPVGMKQTAQAGFSNLELVIPNQSRQYIYLESGEYKNFYGEFAHMLRTAAGMSSTALELADYIIALQSGQLIKEVEQLWQPVKLNNNRTEGFNNKENGYAMGWQVGQRKYHPSISASGANASTLITYPEDDVSVIVLTNLLGALPITFVDDIAAYYIPNFNHPDKVSSYRPMEYLDKLTTENGFGEFAKTFKKAEQDTGVTFDIDIIAEWGFELLAAQRVEDAIEIFQFSISNNDPHSFYYFGLAKAYDMQERYSDALKNYEAVVRLNPNAQMSQQRVAALKAQLKL
ncbi:hypothetical protein PULV_a3314 [Pseudoalteromonas ulvae UL12]|uniref:serine hydrolase n=1 Tax=Pseudoalteromonas ulvae TaxID=107327 RepID=UPI00186BA5B9|nr:serine hydrolase [Pseudoalteromonas ulvae]MBE0365013.1 hypothetical protein [Pseudoalteromonas ulvae UL12]